MALTLPKLIDMIKIDLNVYADDHKLSNLDEFIADKIHSIRATLIREEFNRKKYIDQQYYQIVNCNQIECLKNSCTINGITVESPYDIFRMELSTPLMTGINDFNIAYVGYDAFKYNFKRIWFHEVDSMDGNRWTKDREKYLIVNDDLYFFNLKQGTTFITIVGLFDFPSNVCSYLDTDPYPVPSDYKLQLLVKKDIMETWNVPYDYTNEANAIVVPSVSPQKQQANENPEGV